jgi:tetratricopeptide (TPR) repeat protein
MKKKGFGKSQPSIKEAKKFILAFQDCGIKNNGDKVKCEEFLKANLDKLDESLLEALPLVFGDLTANRLSQERDNFASTFGNFALLINDFSLNDKSLNKELSIVAFKLALKIWNCQEFPKYWAMAKQNLGVAYYQRVQGEKSENIEIAIVCYQEAFKVYSSTAFPEDWARTQGNLGIAYRNRIRGEQADNLETAIACYQEALKVYTFTAFPQDWAMTQMNLGIAYLNRIRGERTDNLETAIAYYQEALNVYTFDSFPFDWARTQMNLGNAYYSRIRGERADNLETAIACYQEALKVFTLTAFPFEWAITQHNLANIYRDRIKGEAINNLEQAILIYQQASQVFTRESLPLEWGENQSNLAESLIKKAALTSTCQDLDAAIFLLQEALEVAVPNSPDFIDSYYRLGNALARRYETSKNPDDLQQSLAAYQIALDYLSPEHYDRQQYWQAIPATQAILGSRLVRDGNWQEGLKLLINSLNQLKTGDNSLVYANALYQTGYAYEVLSDWENARLYYRDALRLYDHLNDLAGIAKSREGLGGVFVSQGYLEKGMNELAQARERYQQLNQVEKSDRVEHLYQVAQRAQEKQKEVMV